MAKESLTLPVRTAGESKTTSLPLPAYLKVEVSPYLFAQVVHTLRRRSRIRRAHTKQRAEVQGGGRKPWKQKHTGRSRHGSIRSPLWVGGGTTFGPRSRHQRVLPVPLKMKRRALTGALLQHAAAGSLEIIRWPKELPQKTKAMTGLLGKKAGLLLVLDNSHQALAKVARNIPGVRCALAGQVTVTQIMAARRVWIDEAALPVIEKRCSINQK